MTTRAELLDPLRRSTDRTQFMGRLRDAARAAVDVVAPQAALSVDTDGTFHVRDAAELDLSATATRGAVRDVGERLQIPLPFLDRLMANHRDLAATNINTLAARDTRTALYRTWQADDGWVLRAVLSDRYEVFDNFAILQALVRGLDQSGLSLGDAEVDVDLTPDRFRLRLATPSVELLVPELLGDYRFPYDTRPGQPIHAPAPNGHVPPALWAGLEISNSETGDGAFQIVPRAVVLVCRNGLTRTVDAMRSVHLGGRLEHGVIDWSTDTRRLNVELLTSKVVDAVSQFVSVDYLRRLVEEMRAAKDTAIGSPTEAVARVKAAHSLTDAEEQAVMDAFLLGGDATVFGVAQAVTAAAANLPDGDRQSELEAAFWEIVGRPALLVS